MRSTLDISALQVIDEQRNQLSWLASRHGKAYLDGFAASNREKLFRDDTDAGLLTGEQLQEAIPLGVGSTPYYIASDMVTLADHASRSLTGIDMVHPSDPVSPQGFMWLADSLIFNDVREEPVSLKAVAWSQARSGDHHGVFVSWFSDMKDRRDVGLDDIRGRLSPEPRLLLLHYGPLWFGEKWEAWNAVTGEKVTVPDPATAFMFTAWTLMRQRIAVTTSVEGDRHLRRRAERSGLAEPSTVKVITLRRPRLADAEDHVPGSVAWSHRWWVNGFWRNQWYPSIQQHRQLWVPGFVKGPADLPLVIKDDVYNWRR